MRPAATGKGAACRYERRLRFSADVRQLKQRLTVLLPAGASDAALKLKAAVRRRRFTALQEGSPVH